MITRGVAFVIGLFLLAVWISGLALHTTPWLTWLDFIAGICAIAIGMAPVERGGTNAVVGFPTLIGLGLLVMWIVGLAVHTEAWITWCTFGAACALLIDAVSGGYTVRHHRFVGTTPRV